MSRLKKLGSISVGALAFASEIMPFINDKNDVNGIAHFVYKLINRTSTSYLKNNNNEIKYSSDIYKNIKLSIEMRIVDS